jgi:hypothetical protein
LPKILVICMCFLSLVLNMAKGWKRLCPRLSYQTLFPILHFYGWKSLLFFTWKMQSFSQCKLLLFQSNFKILYKLQIKKVKLAFKVATERSQGLLYMYYHRHIILNVSLYWCPRMKCYSYICVFFDDDDNTY